MHMITRPLPQECAALNHLRSHMAHSIWLPRDMYRSLPVIFPHAIRDNNAVGGNRGIPDPYFFAKDENCLIKNIFHSINALSARRADSRRGQAASRMVGRVASHIIRPREHLDLRPDRHSHQLAAEINSFVGNLVWLPRHVADMTDYHTTGQPSLVTRYLVDISRAIYCSSGAGVRWAHSDTCRTLWSHMTEQVGTIPLPHGVTRSQWGKIIQHDAGRATVLCVQRDVLAARIRSLWVQVYAHQQTLEQFIFYSNRYDVSTGIVRRRIHSLLCTLLGRWTSRAAIKRFVKGVLDKRTDHTAMRRARLQHKYLSRQLTDITDALEAIDPVGF